MLRFLAVLVGMASLGVVGPALAQEPRGGRDEVRKLQAELERVRGQLRDLEARLDKAKEAKESKLIGPPWGWWKKDPEKMKEMMEKFKAKGWEKPDPEKMKAVMERFKGKGWGKFDPAKKKEMWEGFKRKWEEKDREARGPRDRKGPPWAERYARDFRRPGESADLERRLERIVRELEELRRDLRRR
jgi:hypothetical protein